MDFEITSDKRNDLYPEERFSLTSNTMVQPPPVCRLLVNYVLCSM